MARDNEWMQEYQRRRLREAESVVARSALVLEEHSWIMPNCFMAFTATLTKRVASGEYIEADVRQSGRRERGLPIINARRLILPSCRNVRDAKSFIEEHFTRFQETIHIDPPGTVMSDTTGQVVGVVTATNGIAWVQTHGPAMVRVALDPIGDSPSRRRSGTTIGDQFSWLA